MVIGITTPVAAQMFGEQSRTEGDRQVGQVGRY